MLPSNLKYTKDHEWVKTEDDNNITLGITDYAQGELGDIIFIELPAVGDIFDKGAVIGTIEAVKTVADIFTPIKGEIVDVNTKIEDSPELLNSAPYDHGWIVKIKAEGLSEAELLTKDEYKKIIS